MPQPLQKGKWYLIMRSLIFSLPLHRLLKSFGSVALEVWDLGTERDVA